MFNNIIERAQSLRIPTYETDAAHGLPRFNSQTAGSFVSDVSAREKKVSVDLHIRSVPRASGWARSSANAAAAVASAPLKLTLTPLLGGLKGLCLGAAVGASNGGAAGAVVVISVLEKGTRHSFNARGASQRALEDALSAVVGVPLVLVGMMTGAAVGAAFLGSKKAFDGTCKGMAYGYQAVWDNTVPKINIL